MAQRQPQRALVTGASSGIGAALSRRLAARGVEVWLAARRAAALTQQVERIRSAGGKAHTLVLDVADSDGTYERLARLDEETGGIDLVVANAGIGGVRGAQQLSESSWADVRDFIHINFLGAAATLAPFAPRMVKRGYGHLVGISSIGADIPYHRNGAYGSSKAGLTFFLECADIELRPLGVPVTIVHPGFVKTPMSDELTDPTPFRLSEEAAIDIIDRGIQRRARMIRFPWILGAVARAAAALPRPVMSRAIRAVTSARPKPLPAIDPKGS
jgi:short-subunit dehydrogenase